MTSIYNKDLKLDSVKMQIIQAYYGNNKSSYEISRELGIPARTIQNFLAKDTHKGWHLENEEIIDKYFRGFGGLIKEHKGAKILFFDIETSPVLGNVWSLWQQNVGLNQIAQDWYVLSWAAKWQHEDEVMYQDKRDSWDSEDDSELLEGIWKLLDEADIVVGQNSKRFDEKKLNARFIMNGMKPPSSYRSIDTLEIAKRHFGFTSNKLEYMSDKLCKRYKKLKHGKFAGFELWKECLRGNPEAWDEMEEYNIHDVLALEELYDVMKPWYKAHPNLSLYVNDLSTACICGSDNWEHSGYHYTNLSKFDRFICTDCGATKRGRVNLLTKEKRATILANII